MRVSYQEKITSVANDQEAIDDMLTSVGSYISRGQFGAALVILVEKYNYPPSWKEKKVAELLLLKLYQDEQIHPNQRALIERTLSLDEAVLADPKADIDYGVVSLLPKADLHVHLDGSVFPATIEGEHIRQGIPIDFDRSRIEDIVSIGPDGIQDFDEFLHDCFGLPLRIMQTKEGLTRVAYEMVRQAYRDNLFHIEPRFAPCVHMERGLSYDEVMDSVIKGLLEGQENYGVSVGLIAGIYRDKVDLEDEHYRGHCLETARAVVRAADKYKGEIELGFDIVGKEDGYPPNRGEYMRAFNHVTKLAPHVHITAHAGEMPGTAKNIPFVLANFWAERIGHGIQIFTESFIGLDRILEVPFEICPTSNVQLFCAESFENHPVFELIRRGFFVTINTDNRTISRTTVTKEIFNLLGLHDVVLYEDDRISELIERLVLNGIRAAFIPDDRKEEMLAKARREIELVNKLVKILR